MEKQMPQSAPSSQSTRSTVLRLDRVLAVRLNAVVVDAYNFWCLLVREKVAPHYRAYFPPDARRAPETVRTAHLDRLMDHTEFAGISDIWLNSGLVADAELNAGGSSSAKPLTRQSVSRRLQVLAREAGEHNDIGTYEARATRLIDAMLSYGLLEEETIRPNFKPLKATPLFDAIMRAYHSNLALLIDLALDGTHDAGTEPQFKGHGNV
jgi:hypothetical protein